MSLAKPFSRLSTGLWFVPLMCVLAGVGLSVGTIAIDKAYDYRARAAIDQWRPGRCYRDLGHGRGVDGQSRGACTDDHHGRRATRHGSILSTNRSAHPAGQAQPVRDWNFCRHFRARDAGAA